MRKISDHERKVLIEELAKEFPGDSMMQELHLVRCIHQLETEGMAIADKITYFRRKAEQISTDSTTVNSH
jgi:hypothetical protein